VSDSDGNTTTEMLQHSMVEKLMAVIGAPDDEEVAGSADLVVQALDARLAEAPPTAT
jgi:hypothetical protein